MPLQSDAKPLPGGTFTMAENLMVTRMGYGAMQLAGPHVFGPPADRDAAVAVLREVIELGITHIDTSDFYGPHVTNQIIKEALYPYPDESAHRHQSRSVARRRGRLAPGARSQSSYARPCTTISTTLASKHSTSSTCASGGSAALLLARSPNRSPCSRSCSRRD